MNPESVRQIVTFHVGEYLLGIPVEEVREILPHQRVTPVPLAPIEVSGLMNVRGSILTAIDMRTVLQEPARAADESGMHIVIRRENEGVSLLVDGVGDIVTVTADQCEPPPSRLPDAVGRVVRGVVKLEQSLLLEVDSGFCNRTFTE